MYLHRCRTLQQHTDTMISNSWVFNGQFGAESTVEVAENRSPYNSGGVLSTRGRVGGKEGGKNTKRSFVQKTRLDRICKIIVVVNQVNRTNRFWRIHLKSLDRWDFVKLLTCARHYILL